MKNKLLWIFGITFFFAIFVNLAQANECCQSPVNKITLQLQTEAWATTSTANAIISINATLDKGDVGQLRSEILDKLAKIAAGDWHITSFTQSQNESGLEQVQATAELRLPQKDLANIRAQAKVVSRPGLNFKVSGIDFNPSLDELETTRNDLRSKIYNQVNAEIDRLHKINPNENYTIHAIDFVRVTQPTPTFAGGNFLARAAVTGAYDKAEVAPMLPVSNKIQMLAIVELIPEAIPKQPTVAK